MPAPNDNVETTVRTVLLADDDPFLRELIAVRLRTHGFTVIEAESGDKALPHLESDDITVLVTDISMPGELDGWALGKQARLIRPQIAVVYSSSGPVDIARRVAGSVYLQKPYHPDAVVEAIREATSRHGDIPTEV